MDPNTWLSKARYSFNDINNRRSHSSSPERYSRISARSNFDERTSTSMPRKRHYEEDDTLHARKSMQYSKKTSHTDTSYQSFDVYRLVESSDVNDTTIYAKRFKCSEKHEISVNLENHPSLSEDMKQKQGNHTCEKHAKEKTRIIKLSTKNSKNISCHSNSHLEKLEKHLKLLVADKSVKSNKNLRSSQKSKSTERKSSKNELVTESKKSCNDKSDDNTLILCIDQEEADEVLFGDIRNNIKQKMDLRSLKKA